MEFPYQHTYTIRGKKPLEQLKAWAATHAYCSYYTDNGIEYPYHGFRQLLAVGAQQIFTAGADIFTQLQEAHSQKPGWLFGYLSYSLKNDLHGLQETLPDRMAFPLAQFYRPTHLFILHTDHWEVFSHEPIDALLSAIQNFTVAEDTQPRPGVQLHTGMEKDAYLEKVAAIQHHILEGDCYELNLCQEFWAEGVKENGLSLFNRLNERSPMPFACYQRFQDQQLICASPERFMRKTGDHLLSQPIKGTAKRGHTFAEDVQLKENLRHSEKEQAENLMIVDLVRNDLAMSAIPGSVKVIELFGIYSFRQVHQMISSVEAHLRPELHFTTALRNAFPMGSMTGAPKRKVMELIDRYENVQRGLYSGAAGYITPEGDFDFNVVIRSILLDSQKQLASFQVGSAITYDAEAAYEYEECLLKAKAMREILEGSQGKPNQPSISQQEG